ncbi:hypothetical protein N183_12100 [Sinorhizobium sp. Sb3]|uniref:hypothetical protein n=1 Tax=Sinorhizobium sp. Sb3 TaxID=1358417 RepID=UPI00071CA3DA|nr:hypothetical protein [Sinorhizobium sp. Sb3]KSV84561.1 hypothetical protein N183_12100 [Sinorhizobium sp. Sb3]
MTIQKAKGPADVGASPSRGSTNPQKDKEMNKASTTTIDDKLKALPFTAMRDGKQLPMPMEGQLPRCFWHVAPTGNYGHDCRTGNRYALEYLAYEEGAVCGSGILNLIVNDMPRPLTGIENGFLSMVCFAAGAGAHRARQIKAYWDKCAAEEVEAAI